MCVLGKTHPEVVQMFQSIPINQYVDMVLCHGYPLPPDVDLNNDDPLPPPPPPPASQPQQALHGGEVVTAVPLINGQPLLVKGDVLHGSSQDLHYVTVDASGRPVVAAIPNGRQGDCGEVATSMLNPELVNVPLVKGPGGFGFAIADCPLGQKVKMILDAQWCRGLQKGDVIKEINKQNVQALSHAQVVDILKELPVGSEVNVIVLRGGESLSVRPSKCCIFLSLKSHISSFSFGIRFTESIYINIDTYLQKDIETHSFFASLDSHTLMPFSCAANINMISTVTLGGDVSMLIVAGAEVLM